MRTGTAIPPSLRDVVWRRVRSLGDDGAEVLTTASVLGVEFYEDVLIDMMAGHAATVVRDALDTAERNGLLLETDSVRRTLQFVHALVANALYADVGTSRRAHLHGRAADALRSKVDELPADVVVQLAALQPGGSPGRSSRVVDPRRRSRTRTPRTHRGRAALSRRARPGGRARPARVRTQRSPRPARRRPAPSR